jgi:hypothetical protein
MAYTPTRFYHTTPGTGTTALLFQIASGSAIIKQIILTNTTATAATITMSLVPAPGTTPVTAHLIANALVVPPNATTFYDLSMVMAATDAIFGTQGTAAAINVSIHGVTF